MDGEIREAVTEWATRPVADGVAGLHDLADDQFSGAVTDGTTWAFVLNGRFVGVFDGDVEDFEDASLTAHVAPDRALPLLFAMRARGGEVRGEYYSNETPLREVDETLSSGNFVGYVELSENVLSGDYYVVYYGGRALPVAWVGNSRRLLSGDEAFERAADEVGIYRVVTAEVSVIDLPERPADERAAEDVTVAPAVAPDAEGSDADADADAGGEGGSDADEGGADADAEDVDADSTDRPPTVAFDDAPASGEEAAESMTWASDTDAAGAERSTAEAPDATGDGTGADGEANAAHGADAADGETTAETGFGSAEDAGVEAGTDSDAEAGAGDGEVGGADATDAAADGQSGAAAASRPADADETAHLRERIAELEAEIERLEGDATEGERTMAADEALAGIHLFVRYEDQAAGTLEDAVAGRIDAETLRGNLRLEHHADFETAGVRIGGDDFETFLRDRPEHRFVEWLVTDLSVALQRSDADLSKLRDALERVDRIDFDGEVAVGEDAVPFDVVVRDRMGDPLFGADFESSREATRGGAVRSLLDGARTVSEGSSTFAAAFFVTTSFYEADAMEVAIDATRGGLFSRSARRSYVKLSRKSGFHLCLVEARDGEFYLTEPAL